MLEEVILFFFRSLIVRETLIVFVAFFFRGGCNGLVSRLLMSEWNLLKLQTTRNYLELQKP